MNKMIAWLREGATFWELFKYLPGLILLQMFLIVVGVKFAGLFFSEASINSNDAVIDTVIAHSNLAKQFFIFTVKDPFYEEVFYRFTPFCALLVLMWLKKTKDEKGAAWDVAVYIVVTSAFFGYVHGPGGIFIQGLSGIVLAIVFLKWSALGAKLFKGLLASTIVHGAYNGALLIILLSLHR